MFAKTALVLGAAAQAVLAANDPCSQPTTTIDSQAAATGLSSCKKFDGDILITNSSGTNVDISGPEQVTGDIVVEQNMNLQTLSSTSLNAIGGTFKMDQLTALSTLKMPSLANVNAISWTSLGALNSLNFGPISTVGSLVVADTFLSSISGIDPPTIGTININNNRRMSNLSMSATNVSQLISITSNGQNGASLAASFPQLIWAAEIEIDNCTELDLPSLQVVNNSIKLDSNGFSTFQAPNLTTVQKGDVSFIQNGAVTNISFPQLTKVGGSVTLLSNGNLLDVDGFPNLKEVDGAIKVAGVFNSCQFPALNIVKGTMSISSSADISDTCNNLKKLAPSKQGGGGQVGGSFNCTANDQNAANDTTKNPGSGSGGSDNAAGVFAADKSILFAAAVLGLAAQAVL